MTARAYAAHGYPWFDLYDENRGDVAPADELAGTKSIKEMDEAKGFGPQQDDASIVVPDDVVKTLTPPARDPGAIHDGAW